MLSEICILENFLYIVCIYSIYCLYIVCILSVLYIFCFLHQFYIYIIFYILHLHSTSKNVKLLKIVKFFNELFSYIKSKVKE